MKWDGGMDPDSEWRERDGRQDAWGQPSQAAQRRQHFHGQTETQNPTRPQASPTPNTRFSPMFRVPLQTGCRLNSCKYGVTGEMMYPDND